MSYDKYVVVTKKENSSVPGQLDKVKKGDRFYKPVPKRLKPPVGGV